MGLRVGAGNAVGVNFDRVVTVAGIRDSVHHADVGGDAAYQQLLRCEPRQPFRQIGVEKATVALLGDDVAAADKLGQLRYYLGFFGAYDTVDREHLELQVFRVVVVGQE